MRNKASGASAMMEEQWRQQCDINAKLQRENARLKRHLSDIQGDFQSDINALKHDLQTQIKKRQNDISHRDCLDELWKQLQEDDQVVKQEITEIINKHTERRSELFVSAKKTLT